MRVVVRFSCLYYRSELNELTLVNEAALKAGQVP